jgi:hypothetical protein
VLNITSVILKKSVLLTGAATPAEEFSALAEGCWAAPT